VDKFNDTKSYFRRTNGSGSSGYSNFKVTSCLSSDQRTKEQIYTKLGKHLLGDLIDHKGHINGVYNTWGVEEEVWIAHPSSGFDHVGASRIIVISKKTGKILADCMYGE